MNTPLTTTNKIILFFGDSLTAGYGLRATEAFPYLIQTKVNELGLHYNCVNAGLSGETSAGGVTRIDQFLKDKVDVFVLELGINDAFRAVPVEITKRNLQFIINKVKMRFPQVQLVLAEMLVPPYFGLPYANDFQKMFTDLAQQNKMAMIPFLLRNVAGIPSLNLPDGAHPSAKGYKLVAENVWEILKEVI